LVGFAEHSCRPVAKSFRRASLDPVIDRREYAIEDLTD
jgi:hypothetical protein